MSTNCSRSGACAPDPRAAARCLLPAAYACAPLLPAAVQVEVIEHLLRDNAPMVLSSAVAAFLEARARLLCCRYHCKRES